MPEALKVGIAGLGTVGSETFRILTEQSDFLSPRSGKKIEIDEGVPLRYTVEQFFYTQLEDRLNRKHQKWTNHLQKWNQQL